MLSLRERSSQCADGGSIVEEVPMDKDFAALRHIEEDVITRFSAKLDQIKGHNTILHKKIRHLVGRCILNRAISEENARSVQSSFDKRYSDVLAECKKLKKEVKELRAQPPMSVVTDKAGYKIIGLIVSRELVLSPPPHCLAYEAEQSAAARAEDASAVVAVAAGEASPGTQAARLLCLSDSSTSVETGVLAVEEKVDSNAVAPAEDPQGVAGHHGEVFLDPVLDADLDPFDDFGPNVQFQEDVEGDDEEEYSDDMDDNKERRDQKSRYVLKRLKGGEIRFRMRGELFCPFCGKILQKDIRSLIQHATGVGLSTSGKHRPATKAKHAAYGLFLQNYVLPGLFPVNAPAAGPHACNTPNFNKKKMEPNEPINTKFYQLGNGGSLIFEHDLDSLSDHLGRPHPEFHGIQVDDQPGGELQWIITADLRGKLEPPTSERILFSFRESNWLDGLARALQEALARLCGQNAEALREERFAHLARRNSDGRPMDVPLHPQLRHHVDHLDFMLYQTQRDLDASRAYANQTHAHITEQGEAIKLLNNDRRSLRQQRAKKDATIRRLRARIASLEATVKAQEDQIRQLEDDDGGIDIQGGDAFLSDDDDFEEDENTEEEDYEFLEAGPDDYVPIDIDDEE
ncbi:hypothetical protein QYE76_024042 [Lolium multiflorum]|uniref:Uncharacterized protein n=1 Tax=Lolium multiflorum TaxID=4521 RepID=A0AAD8RBP8_LOLMU|nr:hypothetical protein QYE76_024042 [Lolium multiflorum]